MITFFPDDVEVQPRRSLNFVRWETAAPQDMLQINSSLEAKKLHGKIIFLLLSEKCNYANFMETR